MQPHVLAASVALVSASTVLTVAPAFAHHPGSIGNAGGSGPIVGLSASSLDQGQSVAGVSIIYTDLERLSGDALISATASGNEDVHGLDTVKSYALTYAYGLTHDLTVGFRLPYQKRTGIRAAEFEDGEIEIEDFSSSSGIGDLSVYGQYRFLNDTASRTEAAVIFGVKAPTGPSNRTSVEGELFEAEFQPGSGSWDGLFGLALTRRSGAWSFDGSVVYSTVSTGTQNTDLGDLVFYNASVSYRLMRSTGSQPMFHGGEPRDAVQKHEGHNRIEASAKGGTAVDLILELNGEWAGKQSQNGIDDENSGGNTIYLSPGLRVTHDAWSAYTSFGVPIASNENGLQAEPDWRLNAGVSVGF